jgi:hypothetical protein
VYEYISAYSYTYVCICDMTNTVHSLLKRHSFCTTVFGGGCVFVFLYVCVCMNIYLIYVYIYVYVYICIYKHIYICDLTNNSALPSDNDTLCAKQFFRGVGVCTCIYICVYITLLDQFSVNNTLFALLSTHARTYTHAHINTHAYIPAEHAHTHVYTRTNTYARIHTC